ncbi:glycosyltransferase family 2 protein [bacterium]|nr:glycosyltransferase family 2 protein [bacterium]
MIVTWNSENEIANCLSSIQKVRLPHETIVVDNASCDSTAKIVKTFPKVKLIENTENLKFAKANNQGLKIACGKFKMLLNPDTILKENAVETLVSFLEKNDKVGAVAPKLLNLDGSLQPSCRRFPNFKTLFYEAFLLNLIFPENKKFNAYRMKDFSHDTTCEVDQPQGAAILVRSKVLEKIGLLDERFPMFFNDVDFCFRIKNAGWTIFFVSEAEIYHAKGTSIFKVRKEMIFEVHKAFWIYLEKHFPNKKLLLKFSKILLYFTAKIRSFRA